MTPCPSAAAVAAALVLGALASAAGAPGALARGGADSPSPGKPASGGAVGGSVKDEAGAPVAGAQVVVAPAGAKGTWKATTDAKGAFVVRGLPLGEATVVVRARSRVPAETKVSVVAGGVARADAVLRLGVRFAGKVTDMRGAPVADAVVEPAREGGGSGAAAAALGARRSGADGAFELDGLEPGVGYELRVRHPRFVALELPGLLAEAGAGHDAIEAILEDAAWVKGVVVGPDGKPLPSARVRFGDEAAPFDLPEWVRRMLVDAGVVFTGVGSEGDPVDAQGRFEIGSIAEEDVEVRAIADGYFEARSRITGLVPGQAKEDVRIALEPATAWIEGVVVDAEGKPVPAAKVVANGDHGRAGETVADAQGRFKLTQVRSRSAVTLRASAKGKADARLGGVALNAGGVSVTLQVAPRLRAKVLGPDGKPIAKLDLFIHVRWDQGGETDHQTVTQGAGGIDVPLPLGDVRVEAMGADGARTGLGEWTPEPGEIVDGGTVTLKTRAAKPAPSNDDEGDE